MMDVELDNTVRVEWMILSDHAEVVNGKLYLMGGGFDVIGVDAIPGRRAFSLAIALRVPWNQTNRQHHFEIHVQDEDGASLAGIEGDFETGRPPGLPQGQSQRVQFVMTLSIEFQKAGAYTINSRIDGTPDAHTTFNVKAQL